MEKGECNSKLGELEGIVKENDRLGIELVKGEGSMCGSKFEFLRDRQLAIRAGETPYSKTLGEGESGAIKKASHADHRRIREVLRGNLPRHAQE